MFMARNFLPQAVLTGLALLSAASLLPAQQWHQPVSGYVFDEYKQAIRPVIGSLGSAYLGDPVLATEWASVAPAKQSAWILREGRLAFVPTLRDPQPIDTGEAVPPAQHTVWSQDSDTTLFVWDNPARLLRCRAAENQPECSEIQAPDTPSWRFLAAGPRLDVIAIASPDGRDSWAVWISREGGPFERAFAMPEPAAAACDLAGEHIVAAARSSGQLFRWQLGGAEPETLTIDGPPLENPAALFPLASGVWGLIDAQARRLRLHDLTSGELRGEIHLDEMADGIVPLEPGRLLLNRRTRVHQPLLVLEGADSPRVVFVPAGR